VRRCDVLLRERSSLFALKWALLALVLLSLLFWSRAASAFPQACSGPEPPLVTSLDLRQPHALPEPAAGQPLRDPAFGRCVTRVTDRSADIESGDSSRGIKNEYSRVQAWNADESLLLLRGLAGTWYVWDAATLRKVRRLPDAVVAEPRWDASDPHVLWTVDGTRLLRVDVTTGAVTTKHDFATDFPGRTLTFVWTRWEGSPSADGRTWGLMAEDEGWEAIAFLVYDAFEDRVVATRDVSALLSARAADSVTISPSGRFFLAQCEPCGEGTMGTDAAPCGLMAWDRNLANGRGLVRVIGHGDVAYDGTGREVFVYQDVETDEIAYVDLETGARTALLAIDFSMTPIGLHFSGRSFRLPGWAVVSTYDETRTSEAWMDDSVFLVELKAGGGVVRLAHTRSLVDPSLEQDYWAEPHATANRDLSKVLFTSNWGRSGTEEVETFVVTLPAGWSGESACPPNHVKAVPAAAHAPGAFGSLWRTDVAVVNASGVEACVAASFVPAGGGAKRTWSGRLPPGERLYSDVLVSLFGVDAASVASGALRFASDRALVVSSRTWNATSKGTYGAHLAGVSDGRAVTPERPGVLPQLKRGAAVRTNVGLTNLGTASATAAVRLVAANGTGLGSEKLVTLPPGGLVQLDDVFTACGAGDAAIAWARIEVRTAGAKVFAYASVIDNATSDPTIVPVIVP
jgi:hypothetical protein